MRCFSVCLLGLFGCIDPAAPTADAPADATAADAQLRDTSVDANRPNAQTDARVVDARLPDARLDANPPDARADGAMDARIFDGRMADAGPADAAVDADADGSSPDAIVDLGVVDAAPPGCDPDWVQCEAGCTPPDLIAACGGACCPILDPTIRVPQEARHVFALPRFAVDTLVEIDIRYGARIDGFPDRCFDFPIIRLRAAEAERAIFLGDRAAAMGDADTCSVVRALVPANQASWLDVQSDALHAHLEADLRVLPAPAAVDGDRFVDRWGRYPRAALMPRAIDRSFEMAGPVHVRGFSHTSECVAMALLGHNAEDPQARPTFGSGSTLCGSFEAVLGEGSYRAIPHAPRTAADAHAWIVNATPLDWPAPQPAQNEDWAPLPALGVHRADFTMERAGTVMIRQGLPWACNPSPINATILKRPHLHPHLPHFLEGDGCWQMRTDLEAGDYRVWLHGPRFGAVEQPSKVQIHTQWSLDDPVLRNGAMEIPALARETWFTTTPMLRAQVGPVMQLTRDGVCVDDVQVEVREGYGRLFARGAVEEGCMVLRTARGVPRGYQLIFYGLEGAATQAVLFEERR